MKLIYGRAGSGKSEYVLNEVAKSINDGNKKIYIITPEQFSFTTEKRLLEKIEKNHRCAATLNVEVISFERMAYRVINELFNNDKIKLENSSKAMIIFDAINKNKKDLKFLGSNLENVDTVITQITEFKKHNISVKMLENQVENTNDEYLKAKLRDMLIMYKAMQSKLTDDFIDENDLLTILAENIENSHLFDNSIIYIDEFAGFTKQEFSVIEKLEKIAKELYITICTDELRVTKKPENDIFYDNKQTVQTLKQISDIDDENQIKLSNSYRFKNEELKHLEQNLFSIPYKTYNKETENIELYNAENQYEEIEHISEKIFTLVRDNGYRYNDIAVICNNIDTYSSMIKAIFMEHQIPVFIDEKKDVTQNVLIKYAISVLEIFSKNWTYESVFNYLKTGIIKIDDIFELENYCLKWGIKGTKFYKEKWNFEKNNSGNDKLEDNFVKDNNKYNNKDNNKDNNQYINEKNLKTGITDINFTKDQEMIIIPLLELKEELKGNMTAKKISQIIYSFYKTQIFGIDQELNIRTNNNNNEIKNYHISNDYNKNNFTYNDENVEAWNLIVDALAEISNVFKNQKMNFDEYSKILKTALQSKEIGQIPSNQDSVIVGAINRTKTHKVKAVFIIGVNDGVFPSKISSEGFFNDKDRENLKKENFELAKGTIEKMYEENFNIYKALTTAEEKLFISYSSSDTDSKALRKSLLISKIKRIFPKIKEETKDLKQNILTKDSTFLKLLENINNKEWAEVYEWYKNNEKEKLQSAVEGLNYTNLPQRIEKENIEKLYGNNMKTSVSKLETYMSCPFSYYLKYGLKINEKEKLEIKTIDTGSFMHEVIDEFFKRLNQDFENDGNIEEMGNTGNIENTENKDEKNIDNIEEKDIEKLVEKIVNEKLENASKFNQTAKYRVLVQRLKRVITISLKYIIQTLKNSKFKVLGTEVKFDNDEDSKYPPIEMKLDNGKTVSIIGKIDRIDIAKMPDGKFIRIIDYKSSTKDIDLNKFIAGLQLQLITYVDATCKNENAIPAGALYFSLLEPKIAQRNISKEEIEDILRKNYRMNGLVLANVNVIKAMDTKLEDGKSDIVPVSLKNGEINGRSSSTVTQEEFENLQKYAVKLIKQISKQILSGNIDLKPYYNVKGKTTPCSYCAYKSICQFDQKLKNNYYRVIPNDSKKDILNRIENT